MNRSEHEGTWQLLTAIVIAIVAALQLWNLAIRPADAAPLDRTCRLYPVTLHNVSCFLGRCSPGRTCTSAAPIRCWSTLPAGT